MNTSSLSNPKNVLGTISFKMQYVTLDIWPIFTCRIMSQLGPNFFGGSCNISTLDGLSGLASAQIVDFTASGLSGTIPASWANGAWSGSLKSLTLAQNPNLTGPIPSFAKWDILTIPLNPAWGFCSCRNLESLWKALMWMQSSELSGTWCWTCSKGNSFALPLSVFLSGNTSRLKGLIHGDKTGRLIWSQKPIDLSACAPWILKRVYESEQSSQYAASSPLFCAASQHWHPSMSLHQASLVLSLSPLRAIQYSEALWLWAISSMETYQQVSLPTSQP